MMIEHDKNDVYEYVIDCDIDGVCDEGEDDVDDDGERRWRL